MNREKDVLPQEADSKAKKPRRKKSDSSRPAELKNTFIGQQVHGILDGSFDAGYLLTVRIGDSPNVLRGMVFEPGLSIPLSKMNDVAPKVDATMRDPCATLSALKQPVVGSVVDSSPTQLTTAMPPPHIPATGVTDQSTPSESQAPMSVELEEMGSEQAGPKGIQHDQVSAEQADLETSVLEEVATEQEEVGEGQADAASAVLLQLSAEPEGPLATDGQDSLHNQFSQLEEHSKGTSVDDQLEQ